MSLSQCRSDSYSVGSTDPADFKDVEVLGQRGQEEKCLTVTLTSSPLFIFKFPNVPRQVLGPTHPQSPRAGASNRKPLSPPSEEKPKRRSLRKTAEAGDTPTPQGDNCHVQ